MITNSNWRPPCHLTAYYPGSTLAWFGVQHPRCFPRRPVFNLADKASIAPLPNGTRVIVQGAGKGVIRAHLGYGGDLYEVFADGLTRVAEKWLRQIIVPVKEGQVK